MHVRGYQNTSLDDVLRESGVGKGNFYHHFRSKEDLGYAILDQIIGSFLERTLEPCFSDPEGHRIWADPLLPESGPRGTSGSATAWAAVRWATWPPSSATCTRDFARGWLRCLQHGRSGSGSCSAEAQTRGEVVQSCQPEAVAHFLVAALEGAILLSKVTEGHRRHGAVRD